MDTDIVNSALDSVVRVDVKVNNQWGVGSGLLLDDRGNILTCDHVIHPYDLVPQVISVVRNSEVRTAQILNFDKQHDLAIINAENLKISKSAKYINREVHVGEEGFILGFPTGLSNLTLTKATISAKGKGIVKQFPFEIIQVDARVNHGNSGGPLFTEKGEVVGIVTMKYIPFLTAINELHNFVNSLPQAGRHGDMVMSGYSTNRLISSIVGALSLATPLGRGKPLVIFFQEIGMSHISQYSLIDFTKLLSVAAVISPLSTLSFSYCKNLIIWTIVQLLSFFPFRAKRLHRSSIPEPVENLIKSKNILILLS